MGHKLFHIPGLANPLTEIVNAHAITWTLTFFLVRKHKLARFGDVGIKAKSYIFISITNIQKNDTYNSESGTFYGNNLLFHILIPSTFD